MCALTGSILTESRKLEATIKRGAKHYKKVLEIGKEIRTLAPAAEGLPPEFVHASPGGRLYEFLVTALSKHFALSHMTINQADRSFPNLRRIPCRMCFHNSSYFS